MSALLATVAGVLWLVWVSSLLVFGRRPELRIGAPRDFIYPVAALAVVLAWAASGAWPAVHGVLGLYLRAGLLVGLWMTLVWVISLLMRDASIMDIAYPLTAFIPVAGLLALRGSWSAHETVVALLTGVWSIRLAGHIALRNLGHGEDKRYAAWRSRFGGQWWWWSFFQVFVMQGVLVWLWSFSLVMAIAAGPAPLGWQHALALLLFAVGFVFQAGSDIQLERFKKQRTDRSQVLDTGLWSLSRHPNYFGEAMIWWSFGALGLVHPWGWIALLCPAYVTWFMSAGSATPMQERYLAKTKPAYADYMRRVPVFFPWSKPDGPH